MSDKYQLTGKIKAIFETKQVSEKFKVREFVVTIDPESQYPQHIKLQATQDRCELISTYAVGNDVTVHFNLRGRESNKDGKVNYWNSLDAWRIEAATGQGTTPQDQTPIDVNNAVTNTDDVDDGLPF